MNLLIVDDLPNVVEGLAKGISWETLGFSHVFTACNAPEARGILLHWDISVMLCDIQMPVESGLELFQWVQSQNMQVYTIFLTSHAEFEYAQQAIKLGAEDYIVQPAPYEEIFNAVAKAVKQVKQSHRLRHSADLGQVFQQQDALPFRTTSDLLNGRLTPPRYAQLAKLGLLPPWDQPVYLCLLYLQKWDREPVWEAGLMDSALKNMLVEIFEPYDAIPTLGFLSAEVYALLIPAVTMGADVLEHQLRFLSSACSQYLDCGLSVYFADPVMPSRLQDPWARLQGKHRQNVTRKITICYVGDKPLEMRTYRVPEIKQWSALIRDGHGKTLEEKACTTLDSLVDQQKMNAKTLHAFYLDFMEMVFTSIDGMDQTIFDTQEKIDIYRSGMRDIPSMKRLIHLTAQSCESTNDDTQDQKARVGRIIRYINEHLGCELKRDDLAEKVNLSPDYMTKIFKAETGITIKEYIIRQKMCMAQSLLRTTSLPISFVAAKVGYPNLSHFSYSYKKEFGISPQEERHTAAP